jgi:hypothetical protein
MESISVDTPPANDGGLGLRKKAGSIDHPANNIHQTPFPQGAYTILLLQDPRPRGLKPWDLHITNSRL